MSQGEALMGFGMAALGTVSMASMGVSPSSLQSSLMPRSAARIELPTLSGGPTFGAKTSPQRIVIGEAMERVRAAAKKLGAETFEGSGMEANRAWIRSKLAEGYEVYDIGPAFSRRRERLKANERPDSIYYGMERMETLNYPVTKLWKRLKKFQGGSPFLGE
ncbi:MAG: hypothetical protein HZA91_12450 [Verrucomicrobia bacterium]|nr:hypothetical protein [Verrucomicrobiota bacterium]